MQCLTNIKLRYAKLTASRCNFIYDLVGNDLFLIHGEALIRHIANDPFLHFGKDGFQILHAIQRLESFLKAFTSWNCQFHIVFFDDMISSLYDSNTSELRQQGLVLLRSALRFYIKFTLNIPCFTFQSFLSPEWTDYLSSYQPFTLLTNDGSSNTESGDVSLLLMVDFYQRMNTVTMLDSIEVHDNKILCFTLMNDGQDFDLENIKLAYNELDLEKCTNLQVLDCENHQDSAIVAILSRLTKKNLARIWLLHCLLLEDLSLECRNIPCIPCYTNQDLAEFIIELIHHLTLLFNNTKCLSSLKIGNLLDGRLFAAMCGMFCDKPSLELPSRITQKFLELQKLADIPCLKVEELCNLKLDIKHISDPGLNLPKIETSKLFALDDGLFSEHFKDLSITDDEVFEIDQSEIDAFGKYQKKPVNALSNTNKVKKTGDLNKDRKVANRARRADQYFMTHIQKYASSLTGVKGKALVRINIFPHQVKSAQSNVPALKKNKIPQEKKSKSKLSKADQIRAENNARKSLKIGSKEKAIWEQTRSELQYLSIESQYERISQIIIRTNLTEAKIILEMYLYRLLIMFRIWANYCKNDQTKEENIKWAVEIFNEIQNLFKTSELPQNVQQILNKCLDCLGFQDLMSDAKTSAESPLSFEFALPDLQTLDLPMDATFKISCSSITFQLLYCGHYMERNMDSQPDDRVSFEPDRWQRDTLDALDRDESVLVIAPTSSGKTFISFYSMEKILRSDDESVLIYIAPSKALVNQIAAEVYARFTKQYSFAGKTVWAVSTQEYSIQEPQNCQILITVPQVLQSMLLSPSLAHQWTPRIKRIIFDEVHSLGSDSGEDGEIWEQLLLFAPCPITALSATVGEPESFEKWLGSAQRAHNQKLRLIHHKYRFSDLRKFIWTPSKDMRKSFNNLNAEYQGSIINIHPISTLAPGDLTIPQDLTLEPRDCILLYEYMDRLANDEFQIPSSLKPDSYFKKKKILKKSDIVDYESDLMNQLLVWLNHPKAIDSQSPVSKLLAGLNSKVIDGLSQTEQVLKEKNISPLSANSVTCMFLPMVSDLKKKDLLPGIFFNYDRAYCDFLAQSVLKELEDKEREYKETSEEWKMKLRKYKKWQAGATQRQKEKEKLEKEMKQKSRLEAIRNADDAAWLDLFDPEEPLEAYSLASKKSIVSKEELNESIKMLQYRNHAPEWAIECLRRGIGVHHGGMNRRYRNLIEILFRSGFLQVVIATGTLALGINMPCKTTCFIGDSIELNSLNFRQASGRAGRRGFDLLGHVGFLGISQQKINRLLTSQVPKLQPKYRLTTTYILRLMHLIKGAKRDEFATRVVKEILSQVDYIYDDPLEKQAINLNIRLQIEYLRRERLLSAKGQFSPLVHVVDNLQFCEPSNLIFVALLQRGVFHRLCQDWKSRREQVFEELMIILSFIFVRRPIDLAMKQRRHLNLADATLRQLPTDAKESLNHHDTGLLSILVSYAELHKKLVKDKPDELPISHTKDLPCNVLDLSAELQSATDETVRSKFTALSGLLNHFEKPSQIIE